MQLILTFVLPFAFGFAGMIAHYVKRRLRGQTSLSFWGYAFKVQPGATRMSAAAMAFAVGSIMLSGIDGPSLLLQSALVGFTADSLFNKADV